MKAWPIIVAVIIVIIIIASVAIYYVYSDKETAISEVGAGTSVAVGAEAALANGAPATTDTVNSVASTTGTVPVVVTAANATTADSSTTATTAIAEDVAVGNEISAYTNPVSPSSEYTVSATSKLGDYLLVRGADMYGFDITQRADLAGKPNELADLCSATSGCVAFNHEGYLKKTLFQPDALNRYVSWNTATDPKKGLFYAKSATFLSPQPAVVATAIPSYTFAQGLDMYGYDLPARTDLAGNLTALAAACEANSSCVGFNSAGYLKSAVFDPLYLMQWKLDQKNEGLYYKPSKITSPMILLFTNTSGTADSTTVSLGPGVATLSDSVKYIQIPRNMAVLITKDSKKLALRGFVRGNISDWSGGRIVVAKLS